MGQAHLALADQFRLDQLAVAGIGCGVTGHAPFLICTLVDGHNPPTFRPKAKNAQHLGRIAAQSADQAGFVAVIFADLQAETGEVVLVGCSPDKLVERARLAALDGQTWNNPTLVGDKLLVRNAEEAACYELPLTRSEPAE